LLKIAKRIKIYIKVSANLQRQVIIESNDVKPYIYKRYSYELKCFNIILQEKGFHHINGIYKLYIIRDVLDTSNINSVIILNSLY